jgi:Zn-dependent protease with chaperone function
MPAEHPVVLQRNLGISDTRFLLVSGELFAAGCFLLAAEAVALMRLSAIAYDVTYLWWLRYLGPLAVLVGSVLLWVLWRREKAVRQSDALEVELNPARHQNFLDFVHGLLTRTDIHFAVELRYLPWGNEPNAFVTKRHDIFFITVTRGLVMLSETAPEQAEAILSHEVSHIQADDIRFTNVARDGAGIALLIIAGLNLALLLVYVVQVLVFGNSQNALPVAGALLTSAIAPIGGFLYYREYLFGREFVHDLRAVQLMNSPMPLSQYLSGLKLSGEHQSLWSRFMLLLKHFRAFHPTPEARLQNLVRLDPYRAWGLITPILAGAFLALLPIQLALASAALGFPKEWQKVAEWVLLAVTTLLLLKSDFSRLAVYLIQRDRVAFRIPMFFALVLFGSFLAVFPFIALSSAVRGRPLLASLLYTSNGVVWTAIGYVGAAAYLAYAWGVYFLSQPRSFRLLFRAVLELFSLVTVVLFILITLSRGETSFPLFPVLVLWSGLSVLLGAACILFGGCIHCGARSWNPLWLANRCANCHTERIPQSVLKGITF